MVSEKLFFVCSHLSGSVGKTSLFTQFCHGEFDVRHNTTLQATYETKRITLADNRRVDLAIWDTAGQERFHSLGHLYYRNAQGAILVYDITDMNSFERVQAWVKELRKMLGQDVVLVIVGNKIDLEKNRVVPKNDALEYAKSVGATHCDTSAKQNVGVREMFSLLTKLICDSDKSQVDSDLPQSRASRRFVIEESTSSDTPASSGGCCSS